jgi:hypothetical protein
MKRVEATPLKQAEEALGPGGETEFTFLLVPVSVYEILSRHARAEDCSVGAVFQRAVMQYLRAAAERDQSAHEEVKDVERPETSGRAVIVKRGR